MTTDVQPPSRGASNRVLLAAPLAAFLVLAAFLGYGLWRGHPSEARVDAIRPLPAFDLKPAVPGAPGLAKADLVGRVSLINVFASWCPSCADEQPMLKAIAQSGPAPLYGVAWLDQPDKTAAWLNRWGDPFARVGEDPGGRLGIDLGVTGAPETFVVDKTGMIRYRQIGPITEDQWRETLAPLIAKLQQES
jgi:cytochrome c biogenesis protein CcmG, thiol:disulfide interchange protein DsbE